jgi:hypothetical protein
VAILQNFHETCDYMGNVSFPDRFELLELLRDGEVQIFRVRERATGRDFEAHFASSADLLPGVDAVVDRGSHEGKVYVVASQPAEPPLDSAGAWRIKPQEPVAQPAPVSIPESGPGDFTRMFQLRQAPEPVAVPVSKSMGPAAAVTSQPGEFTRVFQRPVAAPAAAPDGPAPAGQPGEFTRMFQKPAVPAAPAPASQRWGVLVLVAAVVLLSAIAVVELVRRLY